METTKRAVVLAAVLAFLRAREGKKRAFKVDIYTSPHVSAWRLARVLDVVEIDVSCYG
ncbi:MAG: hypothetical protein ABWK01_08680 [Infirmifilum sp.]